MGDEKNPHQCYQYNKDTIFFYHPEPSLGVRKGHPMCQKLAGTYLKQRQAYGRMKTLPMSE